MEDSGCIVLVVDDDPSLRFLCRVNLELEGYKVLEAATLDEARFTLAAEPVDLVLLDVKVGNDDGLALLRDVQGGESRPSFALLTGADRIDQTALAMADGLIAKPFSLDELSSTVRRLALR